MREKMGLMDRIKELIRLNVHYRIIDLVRDNKKFFHDIKVDYNALTGKTNHKYHNIVIVGMSKSGTTRIENFLYYVSGYTPRILYGDTVVLTDQDLPDNAFKYFDDRLYSFVKTHINPNEKNITIMDKKNLKKIILSYRDPRDTAVSRYFRALKDPKKKWEAHSEVNYNDMSKEDGIMHSLKVVKEDEIPWISGWLENYNNDNEDKYIMMKYEDVLDDPIKKFKELSDFFEFNLSTSEIEKYLSSVELNMKKGFVIKGTPGSNSTFRKGISGDWKNHFTKKHIEFVENEFKEDLIRFGYEV